MAASVIWICALAGVAGAELSVVDSPATYGDHWAQMFQADLGTGTFNHLDAYWLDVGAKFHPLAFSDFSVEGWAAYVGTEGPPDEVGVALAAGSQTSLLTFNLNFAGSVPADTKFHFLAWDVGEGNPYPPAYYAEAFRSGGDWTITALSPADSPYTAPDSVLVPEVPPLVLGMVALLACTAFCRRRRP